MGDREMKKSENNPKKKETYFICPYCAELTTGTKILLEAESGGPGFCDCQYTTLFWSPEFQDLVVGTGKMYHEYTEISKSWYDCLKEYDNNILRRDAFEQIPAIRRLDYGR